MEDFNFKICLIGMPGSGKTTIGKEIAKLINYDFIDLDEIIKVNLGKSVALIFKEYGEVFFRDTETKFLKEMIESKKKVLISTGGGTILKNEQILKKSFNIYLRCNHSTLVKRIKKNNERPLMSNDINNRVKILLLKREEMYERISDLIIEADGLKKDTINSIIKKIL
ncbi:shikimate kinase [Alphaproteobacteria bacterium]|nr:shikimate kinase [Alphaproteobacteria bacterium]